MREQREPWLKLPESKPGGDETRPATDPRFRTHVVTMRPVPAAQSGPVLPFPGAGKTQEAPTAARREPEPMLLRQILPRPVPSAPPRAAGGPRAPASGPLGITDLPVVSSADWVAKVGEAAKMVDVVAVFYSAACLGSEVFEFAFHNLVNEVLPQMGRPYTLYRFSLDAEPDFVVEMAESLGLMEGNAVTAGGFAWSGPGRRLILIGDHALETRSAFQRFLRRSTLAQRADFPAVGVGARARSGTAITQDDPLRLAQRAGTGFRVGRVFVAVAWCLFGTAALGAVVIGVEPKWARSVLGLVPSATTNIAPPPTALGADAPQPAAPADLSAGQAAQPVKPAAVAHPHVRKRHPQSSFTVSPTYWGLPENRLH